MTAKASFKGSFTALVTPFRNGSLDEKAFRDLIEWPGDLNLIATVTSDFE